MLHGLSQPQAYCPFLIWTFGQPHFFGWPCFFHDNVRDVSWRGKGHWGRWDNRKGYIRLKAESFRYERYKGVLWENEILLSESHRFRWYQRKSPLWTCPRRGGSDFSHRHLGMNHFCRFILKTDPLVEKGLNILADITPVIRHKETA